MIPWLIGAAVVGIAAAIVSDDDDNSTAGTIKRVIRNFWDGVVDAFYSATAGIFQIVAERTFFKSINQREHQHINEIYTELPDGRILKKTKIETQEEVLDKSELDDDIRSEIENNTKADVTEGRKIRTNTFY